MSSDETYRGELEAAAGLSEQRYQEEHARRVVVEARVRELEEAIYVTLRTYPGAEFYALRAALNPQETEDG